MLRKRFLLGGLLVSVAGLFLATSLTGAAPLPWRSDSPAADARTAVLTGGLYNPLPEPPGSHALAALPDLVNFQGLLTDPGTGNPVPDATYSIRFSVWSLASGGTEEWAETQNVTTVGGLFSVALGDGACVTGCPLSDVTFDGSERWLEVKVEADPAMTPRLPFLSVPYAFHAETADSANSADFATDADTVDGAHASALEESAEIDSDITAHSALSTAHHTPPTTLPPSGAAGGDLFGTYPNPSVANDSHSHTDGTVSDSISINNSRLYAPAGAGNLGVGTTNPLATLTVNDNIPNQFPAVPGITIGNPGGNAFIAMGADGNRDISMAWLDSSGFGEVRADGGPLVLQRFSGNVGIGTPSTDLPDTKLEVNGGSTYVSDFDDGIIFNTDLDNTPGHHFVIKGTAFSPDESLGFYHWNTATPSDNPAGSLIFRVDWQGDTYGNTFNTVGLDVAESYADFEPGLEAGDVVALDSTSGERLVRATSPYQSNLLGIVSDDPGVLLGGSGGELDEAEGMPLALSGKVPVRVTLEGGAIGPGDYLTSSSTPGFAMKATEPGATIGIALVAFDGSEGEEGKVLSFVSLAERNSAQAVKEMQTEIETLETRLSALEGNQDGPSASAQTDSRGSDGWGGLPLLLIVLTLAGLLFALPAVVVTRRVTRGTWL